MTSPVSFARQVFSNTLVQFAGRVGTTLLGIASVALLTRALGVAGYGEYTTAFAFVSFFAVVADAGFFVILLRELSKDGSDQSRLVRNVLTARTVLGIFVFGLAALAGTLIPQYTSSVRLGIAVLSFASLWLVMNQTVVAVFQRHLKMGYAVLAELVARTLLFGLLWLIVVQGGSFAAVMWAYVVANAANFLLTAAFARRFVSLRPAFDLDLWQQVAREALPVGIVLVLHVIYFKVDALLISLMKGSVDVGIYGAPYKVVEVLLTIPTMFLGNLFPSFTALLSRQDAGAEVLYQQAFRVLALVAAPIAVLGAVFASPALELVAGEAYVTTSTVEWLGAPATGATTLRLLFVAVGVAFFSALANYVLVAAGRQRALVLPNLVFVVVNVGANLFLIPSLSYVGAALATILTELVAAVTLLSLVRRWIGLSVPVGAVATPLLSAGAAALLGNVFLQTSFLAAVLASATTYGALVWRLGALPPALAKLGRGRR